VQGIGESKAVAAALFEEAKAGDVLPQVYEIGGDEYVLRLVARREPDMKKFQDDKPKLMAQMSANRAASFCSGGRARCAATRRRGKTSSSIPAT